MNKEKQIDKVMAAIRGYFDDGATPFGLHEVLAGIIRYAGRPDLDNGQRAVLYEWLDELDTLRTAISLGATSVDE